MTQAKSVPIFLLLLATPLVLGAALSPSAERHVEIFTGLNFPPAADVRGEAVEPAPRNGEAPAIAQSASKPIPAREPVTDAFIVAKVRIEFERRSQLRDLNLDVKVRDGVVELTGRVETPQQAELAVSTVREVDGVRSVKNALEVKR